MSVLPDTTTVVTQPGKAPELVFVNGAEQRVIALDHAPFTIGRKPDKDIVLVDARVSRDHASIEADGGNYFVVDAGSKQGTFLNGERIDRHKLKANDRIEFGAKGGPYLIFSPTSVEQLEASKELAATSRVSIFSKLSASDIEELGRIVTTKQYAADTAVFFQGEPSDSLYMVLKGCVKVQETSPDGHEKILDILGVGEIFGELSMLDGHPRSATVTTCEPTELASISQKQFREFVATRPDVLWKVLASLCERVRKTSASMLELTSRDVPYRLLAALNQLAEKHGQVAAHGACMINIKFGVDELAAMVGSNRDIVSRLLRRFEQDGLIELGKNKQIIIPDQAALTKALDFASEWS